MQLQVTLICMVNMVQGGGLVGSMGIRDTGHLQPDIFLAMLVALDFTLVSEWVSKWVSKS